MPKQLTGTVSSDKADKTIVITVRARDEKNEAKLGDLVTIEETRPLSARKRFKLAKIIERAGAAFAEADAIADVPEEIVEPKADKPAEAEKPAKAEKKPAKTEETK
jgi:small subunit ribosomal protein S17